MSDEFGFHVLDGRKSIEKVQDELQRRVGAFLKEQPSMNPELRPCG